MGWDISYHPISESEIKAWYFDVLENQSLIEKLARENNIEEFYKEKYADTISVGIKTKSEAVFNQTHGYYIAVIQGFFQKFFYTRGSALSFSENPLLQKYFKTWNTIFNDVHVENSSNKITTNYCSGVYIPKEHVVALLNDYENDAEIKKELDDLFSYGRITVFLKALHFAKENNLGLLEATEVMEPNPIDLNKSTCYSNLFNCDIDGPMLYQEAAMEQLAEIEKNNNLQDGELASKAEYKVTNDMANDKTEKKSLWKRLFGK